MARRKSPRPSRGRREGRLHLSRFWPSARLRRRGLRAFRRAPAAVQVAIVLAVAVTLWAALNCAYQVIRKPSELFFPVSGTLDKTPSETWREYAPIFRRHSTSVMTPELLAALAQIEASGNPVARTYWRWSWRLQPFELYRPASSAVGMYQITDGTFSEARRSLHPSTRRRRGWAVACLAILLVQQPLPAGDSESCRRADVGVPRPKRRESPGAARNQIRHARAETEARDLDPSLRRRRRRCLRAPRPSADARPAVRRSRCPRVSGARRCDEAGVRPIGGED